MARPAPGPDAVVRHRRLHDRTASAHRGSLCREHGARQGTEAFRLAVGLRNRSSVPIALPWIELSLTDGTGHLVARKALAAAEFKPLSPLLQPGADIVLQTLLSARGLQVTGYTVEVFYP